MCIKNITYMQSNGQIFKISIYVYIFFQWKQQFQATNFVLVVLFIFIIISDIYTTNNMIPSLSLSHTQNVTTSHGILALVVHIMSNAQMHWMQVNPKLIHFGYRIFQLTIFLKSIYFSLLEKKKRVFSYKVILLVLLFIYLLLLYCSYIFFVVYDFDLFVMEIVRFCFEIINILL